MLLLLSRKGPLRNIWIAAHCHKRLKKCQVSQTNISSSVDKILLDEVPVVTYRILGHLLVGIVRIYSKKVEYLFHDCNKVLAKLGDFANENRRNAKSVATHSSCHLISRPRRLELDAFELEVLDDQDGESAHVRPNEDIMLPDAWRSEGLGLGLVDKVSEKYLDQEDISHSPAYSTDHTPLREVRSPYFVESDINGGSTSYKTNLIAKERFCITRFSLEGCLESMTFEGIGNLMVNDQESYQMRRTDDEQIKQPDFNSCNITDMEGFCTFSLEDRLEPLIIEDEEVEPALAHELIKHPDKQVSVNEEELPDKSWNEKEPVDVEGMNIPEMPSSNSGEHQSSENHPVSLCVDVTPDSKFPGGSGAPSPDLMFVRTPATKERPRTLKKRKCLFDDHVVIPNQVYKNWLNNHEDLVCKRRKVPHNPLAAWRVQKLSSLPGSLLEPLIPCSALVDTRFLVCKIRNRTEPVDCVEVPHNKSIPESPITPVDCVDVPHNGMPESPPKHRSREQTPIAPATPVMFSKSWRLHEARRSAEPDILEPSSSSRSIDKDALRTEDHELDVNLMDEEMNSFDEDSQEKYKCTVRTRNVARYLLRSFLARSGEAVNLSCAVKGKTKKESARLFYEILVLKSGCWIDVQQDNAYGDICLLESPKLKQTFAGK